MSPPAGHEPHTWIRKAFNTGDLSLLSEMKCVTKQYVPAVAKCHSLDFSDLIVVLFSLI